jgi:hypothetical protein
MAVQLETLTFERGSNLMRIAAACFQYCSLKSVQLSASVWFIAGNAFDKSCNLAIGTTYEDPEFAAWNTSRQ